jgi:hypothetical protein
MDQQKDILRISELLARLRFELEYLNANALYDINVIAEDIFIPILNLTFNCNLKNVKYAEEDKTFPGIDLIDEKKISIQITSTNTNAKIKHTIDKIIKYKIYKRAKIFYILILGDKLKNYSYLTKHTLPDGKLKLEYKNVLDLKSLFSKICSLPASKINAIKDVLEEQYKEEKRKGLSTEMFIKFKQEYYDHLEIELSRINFFGLSLPKRPREIELEELFVFPKFHKSNNFFSQSFQFLKYDHIKPSLQDTLPKLTEFINISFKKQIESDALYTTGNFDTLHESIPFENLFSNRKNFVILGNPGAGKSSIVRYTILKIIKGEDHVFQNSALLDTIPFRIELFKYNNAKRINNCNIFQYISSELESSGVRITEEDLLNVFTSKKTIVFFDGLDEIFDLQERLEVRNDIERFTRSSQNSFVIVTSRFESYREVSFGDSLFDKMEILDFDDDQIKDYIERWYNIEEQNPGLRKKEIDGCISELKSKHTELKRNPLLLSLIVILYRNHQELPPSKFDIYEGCTKTIAETRDENEKKLKIKINVSNKIATFSSLAYYQFTSEDAKKNITHSDVKRHIKNYLLEKGEIEDDWEAQNAAEKFLEFAKTRSIYVENKFTHKTFLEYFTAYYIFSSFNLKLKREEIIKENINKASWAEILELLICKIDKEAIDFIEINSIADIFIKSKDPKSILFLLSLIKYLQNIGPKKIKELITIALELLFTDSSVTANERYALFKQLVAISYEERFNVYFKNSIAEVTKSINASNIKNYFLFYKEFQEINRDPSLFVDPENLFEKKIILKDPESFIADNAIHFPNWDNYFKILEIFAKKFGKEPLMQDYKSFYGSNIFLQSPFFNFISNALISSQNIEIFISNTEKLKNFIGLSDLKKLKINPAIKCNLTLAQVKSIGENDTIDDFLKEAKEKLITLLSPFLFNESFFSQVSYLGMEKVKAPIKEHTHPNNSVKSKIDHKYNSKYSKTRK